MKYLINGMSGAGKSTIGDELARRGYRVIEADTENGLSSWVNKKSGKKVEHKPPFTKEWLEEHVWNWDEKILKDILSHTGDETIFLIGGADNEELFLNMFDKIFVIYIDSNTMKDRLKKREPGRWTDNSPELKRMIKWNEEFLKMPSKEGVILINGAQNIADSANEIIENIHG